MNKIQYKDAPKSDNTDLYDYYENMNIHDIKEISDTLKIMRVVNGLIYMHYKQETSISNGFSSVSLSLISTDFVPL